ncbi:MAG TPA: hypothetical protein VG815_10270 [Chloroflexota bacterium]|jgi:hypothetical protein|nr:hypothetical protein [Chloroflexota bacterium]
MIVRIQGEGQYELPDDAQAKLDDLDGKLFSAIQGADHDGFVAALKAVISFIETSGSKIADDRLVGSDVILPAPDTSFDEAKRILTDEGFLTPVEA